MQFKSIIILAMVLSLLSLNACKKDKDEEGPVINSVRINGDTDDHYHLDAGSTFELTISVTDNESLKQLKIDIHSADDGHSHELTSDDGFRDGEWEVFEIVDLSGKSQTIDRSYLIPNDQVGEFHLLIEAIDDEGNESALTFLELDVDNDFIPAIDIQGTVPAENDEGEIEVAIGDMVTIQGSINDDDGIEEIHAELIVEGSDPEDVLWEEEIEGPGNSFDLSDLQITIPETTADHLELHIHATDNAGYSAEVSFEIHVE